MDLIKSLEFQNILLITLSVLVLVLIIQNIFLKNKYKKIFKKNNNLSVEGIIAESLSKTEKIEKDLEKLLNEVFKLQEQSQNMIQKAYIKRYNPFKDIGSDQSFTISLLDAKNNGLLLTGLHSREGVRLYAKPIEKGTSKYKLSEEEVEILKEI